MPRSANSEQSVSERTEPLRTHTPIANAAEPDGSRRADGRVIVGDADRDQGNQKERENERAINRAIDLKIPGQTAQSIVSYRAGALTSELELPQGMKAHFDRSLAAGVHHDRIRDLDVKFHGDTVDSQNAPGEEIRKAEGIS